MVVFSRSSQEQLAKTLWDPDGMKRRISAKSRSRPKSGELDALIERITIDAYSDAEQLWAFRQAFEKELSVPCAASVIGEPVTVVQFDLDGNARRGLVAKCRREDGSLYTVSAADVLFPAGDRGGRWALRPGPRRTPWDSGERMFTEGGSHTSRMIAPKIDAGELVPG
jgi:hypothetical protein